jgi:hypothetical protein
LVLFTEKGWGNEKLKAMDPFKVVFLVKRIRRQKLGK